MIDMARKSTHPMLNLHEWAPRNYQTGKVNRTEWIVAKFYGLPDPSMVARLKALGGRVFGYEVEFRGRADWPGLLALIDDLGLEAGEAVHAFIRARSLGEGR